MKRNNLDGFGCFGLVILAIAVVVLGSVANGFVLSKLWEWFVAPTFELPLLSIPVAMGISVVVAMLTYQSSKSDKKSESKSLNEAVIELILEVTLKPATTLLVGWIIYQFV